MNQSPHIITANVFISHAWRYKFLDMIEVILDLYERKEKCTDSVILWFDLFSNNQHKATSYEFEWWCHTFRSAIHEINYTVMVFAPCNDPIPSTRPWCIWELYCTIDTKSKLEIAMSKKEYQNFLVDIKEGAEDVINRMLAKINSENASAWIKADEDRIKEAVRRTIGFNAMNELIFEKMRDWVLWVTETELKAAENRKLEIAILHAKECLRRSKATAPPNEYGIIQSLDQVGTAYFEQGNFEESLPLYEESYERCKKLYWINSLSTLRVLNNCAGVLYRLGDLKQSEEHYLLVLEHYKQLVGIYHDKTLRTMVSIAIISLDEGNYPKAEEFCKVVYDIRKEKNGENHRDTLAVLFNLTLVYKAQGKRDEVLPLCFDLIERRQTLFGKEHPDTLAAMNGVGSVYLSQHKYDEAEPLYLEIIKIGSVKLGADHLYVENARKNLALVYFVLKRYEKALILAQELYEKSLARLGKDHKDTIHCMYHYAKELGGCNRYVEAYYIFSECISLAQTVFGPEHPILLRHLNPGLWTFKMGLFEKLSDQMPDEARLEEHPDHPVLKMECTYEHGRYWCDICGQIGYGIVYHCDLCGYDVHPDCALSSFQMLMMSYEQTV